MTIKTIRVSVRKTLSTHENHTIRNTDSGISLGRGDWLGVRMAFVNDKKLKEVRRCFLR